MKISQKASFNKSSDCKTLKQNYKILSKLGQGSFGTCWKIQHRHTRQIFACKIINNELQMQVECLLQEIKILSTIKGIQGFPTIQAYGNDKKSTFVLMNVLGRDLESIRKQFGNFSIQMGMDFAVQMIQRIQDLHEAGYIHRDIKPENFLVGEDDENFLYLIDFGLGKQYITNGQHIPFKQGKQIIGTTRYSSVNALKAYEQSRRDDLEAIAYVLIYLCLGKLPWQDKKIQLPAEYHSQILKYKLSISPMELTRLLPRQFLDFLTYVKQLEFYEKPDYDYMRTLFQKNGPINKLKETQCLSTNDSIKKTQIQNDNGQNSPILTPSFTSFQKNKISLVLISNNNSPVIQSFNNSPQKVMESFELNSGAISPENGESITYLQNNSARKNQSLNSNQKIMPYLKLIQCNESLKLNCPSFNSYLKNSQISSQLQSLDMEEFPNRGKDQASENILDSFLSERKININLPLITKRLFN